MKTILKLIVMVVLTMLMLSMTKCTSGSAEDRIVKTYKSINSEVETAELT